MEKTKKNFRLTLDNWYSERFKIMELTKMVLLYCYVFIVLVFGVQCLLIGIIILK